MVAFVHPRSVGGVWSSWCRSDRAPVTSSPVPPEVSIVIPVYNEQESIPELARRFRAVRDSLPRAR